MVRKEIGISEAEYAEFYRAVHSDVLRFISLRLVPPDFARAEDVAHEAFLIAWHKLSEIPREFGDSRAWIFTIARNCLLNSNRAGIRSRDLAVRIAENAAQFVPGPADGVGHRIDLAAAWGQLKPEHQEAIALVIADDLTAAEAAQVLGISEQSYRKRLSRARAALAKILDQPAAKSAPSALPTGTPQAVQTSTSHPAVVQPPTRHPAVVQPPTRQPARNDFPSRHPARNAVESQDLLGLSVHPFEA